ncbi:hypothetical protein [Mangrovimonas sp. YM274]|uniref:hypothetical protein n=1 Tax=Mangrovimonas sp. YM274 TaxID=3070660 RepID=UPI0027DE38EC|nr:hypothetical protein [Mangrovimonas sp. YM274]WMI67933.1 hypothetical protein RBH95_12370 [Mangrovimonas sp. YM274]
MKLKLPSLLIVGFTFFSINYSVSQTPQNRQTVTHVVYKDNVNAPFSTKELTQIDEVYGNQSKKYVFNYPQRVKDIKNLLRNRIAIQMISNPQDQKECPLLSEVPLCNYYVDNLKRDTVFSPENFNPLKYLFNVNGHSGQMYRVDNTNYFIIIKSQFQK